MDFFLTHYGNIRGLIDDGCRSDGCQNDE
ncbi:GTP cyclohydrolase I [Reinekea sp. MED297]|uniref:GTP cyclohydrolase I n=1 Tax=Reinekea blandensis MED297 TaxID=314283 RepID=A4BK58_9GAMM|nr:GTP cyclohydrolase I [Reinekea sp. MED297] [Reinekea blandensis MED297]